MGRIYCIMGKSASGKDTLYRRILERMPELGTCVLYTTRPMREGEIHGETYYFTNEEELGGFRDRGLVIESRTYDTVYGPWTYATVDDGQTDLSARDYLVPGTLESFVALRAYFGADKVVPVYIELDDGLRLLRAVERERREKEPKYTELCRRFIADAEDFSEDRLRAAGIARRYINNDLETCTEEIIGDIKKHENI